MEISVSLRDIIEQGYRVFSQYPARGNMSYCPHCVKAEEVGNLMLPEIKNYSAKDLDRYLWKAMTTWGDVNDFKHFLPRIIELLVLTPDQFTEIYIVGSKLDYSQFKSWPQQEQDVILHFFQEWWIQIVSTMPEQVHLGYSCEAADEFLLCISLALEDIMWFLDHWKRSKYISSIQHLAYFIDGHQDGLIKDKTLWFEKSFNSRNSYKQIVMFLSDEEILSKMEKAFFDFSGSPFADKISDGIESLKRIQTSLRNDKSL